ncbi:MotA/TolQ/ExbB proton channel family protein [Pseudovibrio exalbescens]|uniref:MotA/TolQ/ExbB proton channel family protein n=1 Tax=Pseudovibrio exalbescens TaxID=197461 RepID=UPI0023658CC2|nr:MotA/TolQ/ExbB proton channel family protein [Pseudovibrio exalbescens]MDD7910137.1 MotA/TolQ/ExbB proton channel family protein [Pseudovibrio exalbescens]
MLSSVAASGYGEFLGPLVSLLEKGGSVVGLLLVLSLAASTLVVAKLIQFVRAGIGRHARAKTAVELWRKGYMDDAYRMVALHRSPVSDAAAHTMRGLRNPSLDKALIREDVERICLTHLNSLRSHFRALEMIAQIAPLLGLFGTVLGMINAFQAMADAGAQVNPADLASGIWVALLTTAVGLAVAIPSSVLLTFFESRVEREQAAMELVVTHLFTGAATEDDHAVVSVRERKAKLEVA